ncbi:MAG: putative D-alanyl-D-alanine carboxypeptidase/D-alanyl-D-alanine-endopeptidase [Acidobacteria bacterium]|nr:putative D-alanyl-D-alanine carboxypeptidase/D-alanyl-D-alanine-endopeptidase [Acidobacteriota bacterium]
MQGLGGSKPGRVALALLLAALVALGGAEAAAKKGKAKSTRKVAPKPPPAAVWHVETPEGNVLDSRQGDQPVNPASVTKVATTLWALETLGPDHRFETRFLARGTVDRSTGTLHGDLLVEGGGDPDFHVENAMLVLAELDRLGIRRVTGDLVVDGSFWMGWEDGSEGRQPDPQARGTLMGQRLKTALQPRAWNKGTRATWQKTAPLVGAGTRLPALTIAGPARTSDPLPESTTLLVVHRSRPLVQTLRVFNTYSNNDIERIGDHMGGGADLAAWLTERWQLEPGTLRFETTSGLGVNRISPRLIVHLLRDLSFTAERLGLPLDELLPTSGCDPGTVAAFFPRLGTGPYVASVTGKTGTLITTDNGVSVFAGIARTAEGEQLFAVAVPNARGRLRAARRVEEDFVLRLVDRLGGPEARACAAPLPSRLAQTEIENPFVPRARATPAEAAERASVPGGTP